MSLEPGGPRSISPESAIRDPQNPPRQWRNQLSAEDDPPTQDKAYRKYAAGVDRALTLFETALQEWADYISFLNRLLKALQARNQNIHTVPAKATVAKRLSQCLNPSLPSGVHQKALEVYNYVFTVVGKDGLSRDLPLYLTGLAPTLSFASLSVRTPFLDLLERHFLDLDPRSLRPAMKSIILALLPGLEEETAEDFDRTLKLLESFKKAIRPAGSEEITPIHSAGDDFFWQCFFLAAITGQSRRPGALAYLVRSLPKLGHTLTPESRDADSSTQREESELSSKVAQLVTTPEPGLLLRCFAAGLADEQLLIQRGFLDLLVTHLPLHSKVLQERVKPGDLELLLKAAAGVVTRREMSLNRRLWTWLLGPEPPAGETDSGLESPSSPSAHHNGLLSTRTSYFEEYGLEPLIKSLLALIKDAPETTAAEKARPYRICLSLMDRWEIGGLVVPEIFLPIVDSVRNFKVEASSQSEFSEVLRSASTFFDGVESGLIYGEILGQMAQAIGPGGSSTSERSDKLALVQFIIKHFNIREEEMVTVHAPLTALAIFCMIEDARSREETETPSAQRDDLVTTALGIAADLLDIVPERAFPSKSESTSSHSTVLGTSQNLDLLLKIRDFYIHEQGNLDVSKPPLTRRDVGELLLQKSCSLGCESLMCKESAADLSVKCRILMMLISKTPQDSPFDNSRLLAALHTCASEEGSLRFVTYSSILSLSTHLFSTGRISHNDLSELVVPLVQHAWSYLSASKPRYHVETVRSLWQLQSVLTTQNRDIEAAICALMSQSDVNGNFPVRPAEPGRRFGILWSHSLQDNPPTSDRRTPKTPHGDLSSSPRLAGIDNYDVMLARPLFLMLDAFSDEKTQLFMAAKTWLNSLVGVDKIFYIFTLQFLQLPFLRSTPVDSDTSYERKGFTENDDLDLCLYYLRTISNVFRWAPDAIWSVLATKTISPDEFPGLVEITDTQDDVPLQFFLLQSESHSLFGATSSMASFKYTSLRMRNRARRLLEHLFAAETLECLETVIDIWRKSLADSSSQPHVEVFNLLPALDGSRPKHTIPAIFNSIYSRTNPTALDPTRKSNLTLDLQDTDIVIFLVDYARSLEDDAMDEIWQDCITFLKDLLTNPFPHRQTLPSLLEFAAILGVKVDNTNFGEQRKMRRELGDLFLRLLTALFTTRPVNFSDTNNGTSEKPKRLEPSGQATSSRTPQERADDVVSILSSITPDLPKILVENDRVLSAATSISTSVIGPALRAKAFPDTFSKSTLVLLQELTRLPNNQKTWKRDVTDAFNDPRFFGTNVTLVLNDWLPLLKQWTVTDKDRLPELLSRITAPTTAGIVFGVGATSARLEADRKTQLNLRRIATLILSAAEDTFVTELSNILDKLVELLGATATSSPSSTTRAELFMVVRALVLKTSAIHLAPIWPVINAELHASVSSVAAPDHSAASEMYNNGSVLQACKLLDLLICAAPDDFQLHEWLFVTDTIDAVYRPVNYQAIALVDELSEELGSAIVTPHPQSEDTAFLTAQGPRKRPLLGAGGIRDDINLERREELVAKILRPFFGQLSIFAFESTYAMSPVDWEGCVQGLLRDLFDESTIVKAL
ncbi:hypothetical protein SLS64_001859 [Diaporthe eres]